LLAAMRRHRLVLARSRQPVDFGERQRRSMSRAIGLYWHFVDIVWIVIFTSSTSSNTSEPPRSF
jgi:heme/copper-type cytochrome/quinol oxidase subunit 3